ncbi:alpha/beta hydrolase fold domain-containing protein [Algoriphagus yeomjeoni]|uniref:alpha/beta hydrolase fold domain-containing protein n=1 Tax=Algoriphagus yeomjeoni TaxID=291403 RepID=UPI003CE4BD37
MEKSSDLLNRILVILILLFNLNPGNLLFAQQIAGYEVFKDIPYGEDMEQKMDIYLAEKEKANGNKGFTIVFLHGGAYYLSDKSQEERYIEPYLKKGFHVVNLNYRLKRGIPLATSDLTNALNFLKSNNGEYNLNLSQIIVTGFSAGAQIATNVGLAQNNPMFPDKLEDEVEIIGVINVSGPVDDLDVIEKIFIDYEYELFSKAGNALFPSDGYASREVLSVYEPVTYFDDNDPPVFLWHGGLDDQIPPATFEQFVSLMRKGKDTRMFIPNGKHSPTKEELANAYVEIFNFLEGL